MFHYFPSSTLKCESSHHAEELGKFRDFIVEATYKDVEIAGDVAKQMLQPKQLIN